MVTRLHDFLRSRRSEIIKHWTDSISLTLTPGPLTKLELIDHLPGFLDEVITILARAANGKEAHSQTPTAAEHGVQRLRLGFNLESLVREYGMLRRSIVAIASQDSVELNREDLDVLFECLISGIADAVTQYSEEREADRRRQSSEHFGFIAHELRNPLSTAMLALRSLRERSLLPANRQADILDRAMKRMQGLIEHSLGLAFIGAGVELRREPISIRTLIAEASVEAAVDAEDKGVKLQVCNDPDEEFELDHRLMLSALNNLIRNAVKFTHNNTTVDIRWRREQSSLIVEVEDQCGGLPEGKADALFAPFVQAGADRSGFGLGLAIGRQAVEAHGGSIRVRDLPGHGCCFTIALPIP